MLNGWCGLYTNMMFILSSWEVRIVHNVVPRCMGMIVIFWVITTTELGKCENYVLISAFSVLRCLSQGDID